METLISFYLSSHAEEGRRHCVPTREKVPSREAGWQDCAHESRVAESSGTRETCRGREETVVLQGSSQGDAKAGPCHGEAAG